MKRRKKLGLELPVPLEMFVLNLHLQHVASTVGRGRPRGRLKVVAIATRANHDTAQLHSNHQEQYARGDDAGVPSEERMAVQGKRRYTQLDYTLHEWRRIHFTGVHFRMGLH